ncbi:MAG: VOC family protein [Salinisphaeraceae bacterium]
MHLAKPHLDIGLFTADIQAQRAFWREGAGLRLDQELELPSSVAPPDGPQPEQWVQHRFDAHGSVVKVNHWRGELPALPPSGYVALTIASDNPQSWEGRHPDGGQVRLVPAGTDGIERIAVTVNTPDPRRMMAFYCEAMACERISSHTARCGDTLLFVQQGDGGGIDEHFIGPGFRYLTMQVFDADQACASIVAAGGRLAREPFGVGDIARIGFVQDPDGNWIEISARTSLTDRPPEPR